MTEEKTDKRVRIAMGIGGFMIFLASAPCLLFFIRGGYVTGRNDSSGMIGIVGLGLLMAYLGFTLLYHAFRKPRPRPQTSPAAVEEKADEP